MSGQNELYSERLSQLRAEMVREGLDGFLIPRTDRYQGEFVAPADERLLWLTGFTGSAGIAVVLKDKAAVITDARYTLQLRLQVDMALYEEADSAQKKLEAWLAERADIGAVIGYDPALHTSKQIHEWQAALARKNIILRSSENLIDRLWAADRPEIPETPVEIFPESIAGLSSATKRETLSRKLKDDNLHAAIIAAPDSLAWLLNIRGSDTKYMPIALSYGVLYAAEPYLKWFIKSSRIAPPVRAHLGNQVEVAEPDQIAQHMKSLAAEAQKKNRAIGLDFIRAPLWFKTVLEEGGAEVLDYKDPCIEPRAIKTKAEQDSIRQTHITDGAALTSFLAWFDTKAEIGKTTELDVVEKLEEFRKKSPAYKGPSFPTIAGFGPGGAVIHYRPTKATNRIIENGNLLLLDSGGQYEGGTTDITRTIAVGKPTQEMKECFTRVLKGHIAVATARVSAGTKGVEIDALARRALQEAGLNYAHGTGHGVGCYLGVHEEAATLSPRGQQAVQPGMLLSNEPGYYKEGEFGIRTESLVFVQEENEMLVFETVSLAPLDRRLIIKDMLTAEELSWLNEYHADVKKKLTPLLEPSVELWLKAQTAPL